MDEQVWELRERGLSLRQVAAELSMSVGSVRRAIKRQPIELDILAVMRAARCASQPDYHELCSVRRARTGMRASGGLSNYLTAASRGFRSGSTTATRLTAI